MPFGTYFCALLLSFSAQGPYEIPNTCYGIRQEMPSWIGKKTTMCPTQEDAEYQYLLGEKYKILKCDKKRQNLRKDNGKEILQLFRHSIHCPELTTYLTEHKYDHPEDLSPLDSKLLQNIKQEADRLKCHNKSTE